ncbi:unnamed protein product [Cuscuta campestris]|uniref:C3H1-type domain-containing protein n=1 Tax=Cuscuta campestris TaxID=132261 RepID=A0A484LNE4_9ASTE|nr:unnamed protein product [Cuscuta campestris]
MKDWIFMILDLVNFLQDLMCSGLEKRNLCSVGPDMEKKNGGSSKSCSKLLELSASDDVSGFAVEVEEKGFDVNELSFWYGRRIGSSSKRKMGLEERTPLAISSMFGSVKVLKYILGTGKVDVNAACGSDGVTPLHCAVAGGSELSVDAVKLLLSASAAVNALDASGNKPGDYIASCHKISASSRRRELSFLLNGSVVEDEEDDGAKLAGVVPCERKEYPVDTSLPDINTGIYGSDEFRMYSFKVKPCSRAYSHDWTECPFVHPGENARRRDPTKYTYTCVPCPEFKKGSCGKGDGCEFAHGVFESWLHPAQYKTRLCKDETGCLRKVCFFAHKPEELRPLYASTGSALPSPRSPSVSCPVDMGSPMVVNCSSPMSGGGATWQNTFAPPALQFSGSRLKTTLNARDFDSQLMEEMVGLASPSRWNNVKPANLDDLFGSLDSPLGLSPLQSPTGLQMRLQQQHRATGGGGYTSSRAHAFGYDSSAAVAAAVMNSRSASFGKQRSQSFIDRGRVGAAHQRSTNSPPLMTSSSDWGSPDGKPEWGFSDVTNKRTKSASFAVRNGSGSPKRVAARRGNEPDVSWVNSLVKDVPSWMDQMYIEQEQAVA